MSRILGGRARGRQLAVPASIRPSGSMLRGALFDIWAERIPGARFVDLFAGSGAVGLEAASRGAQEVLLVEADRSVLVTLRRNCAKLRPGGVTCRVLQARLPQWPRRYGNPEVDLVFADPPYAFDRYTKLLDLIASWPNEELRVAIEHSSRVDIEAAGWNVTDRRAYGDAALTFLENRQRNP